jgi:hypothetical protein
MTDPGPVFSLEVAHPPRPLHPNAGRTQAQRMRRQCRRDYRSLCFAAAKSSLPENWAPLERALWRGVWYFGTNRRRDEDNLIGWMKAGLDGLTDAGVWVDDSVASPLPPRIVIDPEREGRVVLEVFSPPEPLARGFWRPRVDSHETAGVVFREPQPGGQEIEVAVVPVDMIQLRPPTT